ncbi:MAG: hypothetical protein VX746_01625 [Candidatus Neomarinimicrobiota bacterium]|nr:hypothetical protein [Candidatus Neomarinimicrobiota bacterium]MED5247852.1 hypothetical protein [Candidatus Neomarinimicrobiota bacterium]
MTRLLFIYLLLAGIIFSQEIDSAVVDSNDSLGVAMQEPDSTFIDTLQSPTIIIPALIDTINQAEAVEEFDSSMTNKSLPPMRDPENKVVQKLDSGEPFFEIKSSIDVLRQQVDSLKKIISVYEEGKGAMPNINEELLNLIKIPQLRHRIELQNGTVVNGEIIEEDDLGIVIQTSIGQLAIEKEKIIDIGEDLPPAAKVELINEPFVDIYPDREEIVGTIKNVGTKRADFVRVIANLWSPTTQLVYQDSVFISGQNTKYYTGINAKTSLDPGSTSEFRLVVPTNNENISYRTFEVRWESYK